MYSNTNTLGNSNGSKYFKRNPNRHNNRHAAIHHSNSSQYLSSYQNAETLSTTEASVSRQRAEEPSQSFRGVPSMMASHSYSYSSSFTHPVVQSSSQTNPKQQHMSISSQQQSHQPSQSHDFGVQNITFISKTNTNANTNTNTNFDANTDTATSSHKQHRNAQIPNGRLHFPSIELGNKYEYLRYIGHGSYGHVCQAYRMSDSAKVAIKKVPYVFRNVLDAKRLLRELRISRVLRNSENIVGLLDVLVPENLNDFNSLFCILFFFFSLLLNIKYS
ncbi:Map2 kinase [Reticulomyxa filosa]|uniref:Map2 kinase n=1 Tax=Reticulomyxa filosa TaxID=46433 RepID=X6NWE7_RETFI|nr:Map2 kinase [Reticulomyxa filosa]|eukprot:ETO30154.1 Map2 kinase [Reticulomyxa filosa]